MINKVPGYIIFGDIYIKVDSSGNDGIVYDSNGKRMKYDVLKAAIMTGKRVYAYIEISNEIATVRHNNILIVSYEVEGTFSAIACITPTFIVTFNEVDGLVNANINSIL